MVLSLIPVKPELVTVPESTVFLAGGSAILNCVARGFPEPNITWHKDGNQIGVEEGGHIHVLENGSLYFERVMMTDGGVYYCNASNELGFDDSDGAMVMVDGE